MDLKWYQRCLEYYICGSCWDLEKPPSPSSLAQIQQPTLSDMILGRTLPNSNLTPVFNETLIEHSVWTKQLVMYELDPCMNLDLENNLHRRRLRPLCAHSNMISPFRHNSLYHALEYISFVQHQDPTLHLLWFALCGRRRTYTSPGFSQNKSTTELSKLANKIK